MSVCDISKITNLYGLKLVDKWIIAKSRLLDLGQQVIAK